MNLEFNTKLAANYKSKSQIARILTEDWVKHNSYCPNCNSVYLSEFKNNMPVADFYCDFCSEQFELKSKKGIKVGNIINDGAYSTMISRLKSNDNPNFFFLTYDNKSWSVNNFIIIPKHFFTSEIIIKRKPLPVTAKRAGWTGCNINISKIPENGRIYLVRNSEILSRKVVSAKWKGVEFLKNKNEESKGWILDIMNCVDAIQKDTFSLNEIYSFEKQLKEKYPNNNFIKDKIRQQLQILRDRGLLEFVNRGIYKKIQL